MTTTWIGQARAEGLVSDDSRETVVRPWPVVLLCALAAWLAVPPFLGLFFLLFSQSWEKGPINYIVGGLLVALAVTLLRRERVIFLGQLALPLLLTGLISISLGLARDLPRHAEHLAELVLLIGLIAVLPQAWLRLLLGLACAIVTALLMEPRGPLLLWRDVHWWTAHLTAALGLLLMGLQRVAGRDARGARLAALLEPALRGWWPGVLAQLVWLAGPTFLLGGVIGPGLPPTRVDAPIDLARAIRMAVSAGLTLASAWALARAWRPASAWRLLPPVLVLAALATQMTALGACLGLLALMLVTRRWLLAVLAGVAAVWVIGSFYYQWQLPLATKAWVLVAAGAALAAWAAWMAVPAASADSPPAVTAPVVASPAHRSRRAAWWLLGFGVLVIGVVNLMIVQKEQLIATGRPVFVKLAPVDPRSIMQGDYMALNFDLSGVNWSSLADALPLWGHRLAVAVTVDERGIVHDPQLLTPDSPLPPGRQRIELTPTGRWQPWIVVTDAWYFREGEAQRWSKARYGEFRVLPDGRALLVGLVGEDLKPL